MDIKAGYNYEYKVNHKIKGSSAPSVSTLH